MGKGLIPADLETWKQRRRAPGSHGVDVPRAFEIFLHCGFFASRFVKGLHLFPVPKPDSKCIITCANQSDYISFRHHVYRQSGGPKSVDLKEVGPRFELNLYQLGRNFMQHTPKTCSTFVSVRMRT
ncbi:unnamed protein product [Lactuca saligna]|uniref:Brix domain-containing protein n=1 Tax=Lactuca saligna TaxID=75948 RepID=A0AA35ZPR4_LACSI|nr:unnamed protein product [Lactuca saligna]